MESIWEARCGIQAVQLAAVQQLEAIGLAVPRGEPDYNQVRPYKALLRVYSCQFFFQ